MKPKITPLNYTYKKPGTGLWVLNSDDIPLNKKHIKMQQLVYLGPKSIAGNHKHPRTEWFIGIGDLILYWLNENGEREEMHMNPDGKLLFIEIPSNMPHAVRNNSATNFGILFEHADEVQENSEPLKLV